MVGKVLDETEIIRIIKGSNLSGERLGFIHGNKEKIIEVLEKQIKKGGENLFHLLGNELGDLDEDILNIGFKYNGKGLLENSKENLKPIANIGDKGIKRKSLNEFLTRDVLLGSAGGGYKKESVLEVLIGAGIDETEIIALCKRENINLLKEKNKDGKSLITFINGEDVDFTEFTEEEIEEMILEKIIENNREQKLNGWAKGIKGRRGEEFLKTIITINKKRWKPLVQILLELGVLNDIDKNLLTEEVTLLKNSEGDNLIHCGLSNYEAGGFYDIGGFYKGLQKENLKGQTPLEKMAGDLNEDGEDENFEYKVRMFFMFPMKYLTPKVIFRKEKGKKNGMILMQRLELLIEEDELAKLIEGLNPKDCLGYGKEINELWKNLPEGKKLIEKCVRLKKLKQEVSIE